MRLTGGLNRLDACFGVYNVKIINSRIGSLRVVGGGELTLESSRIYGNIPIDLCEDHGSTRDGSVIMKDVTLRNDGESYLTYGFRYNHEFGYLTYMPETVIIDKFNMTLGNEIHLFATSFDKMANVISEDEIDRKPNLNKTVPPKKVIIRNNKAGIEFILPKSDFLRTRNLF